MKELLILLFISLMGISFAASDNRNIVANSLQQTLETKQSANVTIRFNDEGMARAYSRLSSLRFHTHAKAMTTLRSMLVANSESSQAKILDLLESKARQNRDGSFQGYWITNVITIRNADKELIQELSQLEDIAEIREMIMLPVAPAPVVNDDINEPHVIDEIQWGVRKISAPSLWKTGNSGEGIIVASIDTGVRGTHSILRANFLGPYGWFNPRGKAQSPIDNQSHGSHTMGTIAGSQGYGVAPGAKWMACGGGYGGVFGEDDLLSCGQFIACPTLADGSHPDCSKAPHVVSNSWGSTAGGLNWYDDVIRAWHVAGVVPIFSAGNSGPSCNTLGSPGDRKGVIDVAATDPQDSIAYFSSRGPPRRNKGIKPEISAPGFNIKSANPKSDDAFAYSSGTSMSCPHVAGAVALLMAENPKLKRNYEGVKDALIKGVDTKGLKGSKQNCGAIDDSTFPNYVFGYGRLNVFGSAKFTNATI